MKHSALVGAALMALAGSAHAASSSFGDGAFRPAVPVSAFARPSSWIDLSRLRVSAEVLVGSAAGRGVDGLQITRLQYQIAEPLAMRVSVGNAFGAASRGGNAMFLEGLDLSYRPFRSMIVEFHYQDVRSALQWSRSPLDRSPLYRD